MNTLNPPFRVHLCWFAGADRTASDLGVALYELLHRKIDDNERDDGILRPGVEIPVELGRDLRSLLDSIENGTEPPVDVRFVVVLLDRASYENEAARETVARARRRWPNSGGSDVFHPIFLDNDWREIVPETDGTSVAIAEPRERLTEAECWAISWRVALEAGRALGKLRDAATSPAPRVLISYADKDDEGAKIARTLEAAFPRAVSLESTNQGRSPDKLQSQLATAGIDAVVLLIRTDRYSESRACAMELLAVKRAQVPIVTVLATREGEPWTSAYGGNHGTLVWREDRARDVVAKCMQSWLHGHVFRAHAATALARAGLPSDSHVLVRRPEMIDMVTLAPALGRRLVVHPDPPLTEGELTLLHNVRPSVRVATPTTLLGRVLLAHDPKPPLTEATIALSLSVPEDLPPARAGTVGTGLTRAHLGDVVCTLALTALNAGATVAYGGDFRSRRNDGYTAMLADLHAAWRRLGGDKARQLLCFVRDGARPGDAMQQREYTPHDVPLEPALARDSAQGPLWDSAMREAMAKRCSGRVILGGKVTPKAYHPDGYTSAWPGVLEEAWRMLRHDKPIFVMGGFGGCARAIAEMLTTKEIPAAFKNEHYPKLAEVLAPSLRAKAMEADFEDIETLARSVLKRWRGPDGPRNGLNDEQNARLFVSTDLTEIAQLVFHGLRQVFHRSEKPGEIAISLYHGDIASVPNVSGYAVAVLPGAKGGAATELNQRLGGGLALATAAGGGGPVSLARVPGTELAGDAVLVARLDLQAGSRIEATVVKNLARQVAEEADRLGIESLACIPFGATLGLGVAEAATAMLAGFRDERRRLPNKVVFCEVDGARYRKLTQTLSDATELHAGPSIAPTRSRQPVMLHVHVDAPQGSANDGRINCTLYLPEVAGPVVPSGKTPLSYQVWKELREPPRTENEVMERGEKLWNLLSEEIRDPLGKQTSRQLVVLTNDAGSGLPWEMMMTDQKVNPSRSGGVIRRVALSGRVRDPGESALPGPGARLRVLLVVDPTETLDHAKKEGDHIATTLAGRPDAFINRLDGKKVTPKIVVDELKEGAYDVLHYAGHAFFDTPGKSGLLFANDDVLTANDLQNIRVPRLVFLSACESGRMRRDVQQKDPAPANGYALAEAFLRQGVSAFVGTFFAVNDYAARVFAGKTYEAIIAGTRLGDAVLNARKEVHTQHPVDSGNFLLYGDDALVL